MAEVDRRMVSTMGEAGGSGMPTEAVASLSSLCSLIVDCPHSTPVWTDAGHVVIRNQNIKGGRLDLSSMSFTDTEHFKQRIRRAKPQPGDLIITREAPMGEVCMVPEGLECCLGQRQVLLRPDPSKVSSRYLLFAIQSPAVQQQISWNEGTGSTVSNIRIPVLESIKIPKPPIDEQEDVAGTLGALDDKIALLRETNTTLEAIAQALFKSWFVDFDPVRAKAEGRDPEGVPPEAADLFPSEFEDSELGMIPRGWRVDPLEKHLDVVRGLSYKGSGLTDVSDPEGVPMHNLNSVLEGGGYKYAGLKFYKGEFKEKHQIREGDLIVANTEQGHKHLLIGYPAIVPARIGKVGLFSHHLYRVRPLATSPVRSQFAYRLLLTPSVREQVIGCSNGTTVNMLKADGLSMPCFVCPPPSLIQAFDDVAHAIQQKQECNVTQAESLGGLRDTLLPRLMSGKLRIPSVAASFEPMR